MSLNNTVRCYPRTVAQAFPKDHAAAIEVHRQVDPLGWRIARWTLFLAAAFLLTAHVHGWLP